MTRIKSTPKTRAVDLAAARKAGGDNGQTHWLDRLKAVMKQRAKAEKKPVTR
jgi:hypothetical protein